MSYDCPNGCPRVSRYSSNDPKIKYNGSVVGNDNQNCAKQINYAVPFVSGYMVRTPFPTSAPTIANLGIGCKDAPSSKKFKMGKKKRPCKWMKKKDERKKKFCKYKYIQNGCPQSCGKC